MCVHRGGHWEWEGILFYYTAMMSESINTRADRQKSSELPLFHFLFFFIKHTHEISAWTGQRFGRSFCLILSFSQTLPLRSKCGCRVCNLAVAFPSILFLLILSPPPYHG